MLKMAVFDCAIGGKCCSVDGRRYLPSFFRPTQGDLTAQEPPPPGIYHPRPKWWGGGGGGWVQLEYFSVNLGHGPGGSL